MHIFWSTCFKFFEMFYAGAVQNLPDRREKAGKRKKRGNTGLSAVPQMRKVA